MKKLLLCFFVHVNALGFTQEISEIYFHEAQPSDLKKLNAMPQHFIGEYKSTQDTLLNLIISPDSIYFNQAQLFIFTKKDMADKKWKLTENGLEGFVAKRTIPVLIKNDTVYCFLIQTQTFFIISDTTVAKNHQNTLFLSKKNGKDKWITCLIKKEQNKIILAYTDTDNPGEKAAMKKITPIKTEKNKLNEAIYTFNMNHSRWKEYLNNGGFSSVSVFVKK